MKILTSERFEDGLYLISTSSFTGIVNMSFLSENKSLKEYQKWYGSTLDSGLPISDVSMPMQMIYISSITDLHHINTLAQDELSKSKLTEEDVLIPFLGGVKGYNFKTLVNKLWNIEQKKHYIYLEAIRDYYKNLFKEES